MRCVLFLLVLISLAPAQYLTLNTRLRKHVPIPSADWCAGNWGYEANGQRYLLQTRGSGGLAVVNTTIPENASVVGSVTGISVKEIKTWNNFAYATTDSGPTHVIDLTNPSAPVVVSSSIVGAHTLQVEGNRLYLNRALQNVIEIRDLAANHLNPPLLGTISGGNHDSKPYGNRLLVFGGSGTSKIMDVTNPAAPVQLGSISPSGYDHFGAQFEVAGQMYMFILTEGTGGQAYLYNITNPANISLVTTYITSASLSIHNVLIKGKYAFISYYKDGVRILDISNPASLQEVGIFDPNASNASGNLYTGTWDVYPYHDSFYMGEMYNTIGANTQGAWIVDFFPTFGNGSAGTGGLTPSQWWTNGPAFPGNSDFALRLIDGRPNSAAVLAIGLSNSLWNGAPLPAPIAPGIMLNVSLDVMFNMVTDVNGRATLPIPVPLGFSGNFYTQWAVFDPGVPAGVAVTKGGLIRI
jgi:hypothetical protein